MRPFLVACQLNALLCQGKNCNNCATFWGDLFKNSEICLITLLPLAAAATAATTTATAGHKSRATAARVIVNVIKEHFCFVCQDMPRHRSPRPFALFHGLLSQRSCTNCWPPQFSGSCRRSSSPGLNDKVYINREMTKVAWAHSGRPAYTSLPPSVSHSLSLSLATASNAAAKCLCPFWPRLCFSFRLRSPSPSTSCHLPFVCFAGLSRRCKLSRLGKRRRQQEPNAACGYPSAPSNSSCCSRKRWTSVVVVAVAAPVGIARGRSLSARHYFDAVSRHSGP